MRKSRQETAETRQRIVEAASRKFRENGIENTALAELMAAAGLTHGGFYKHFTSKDQVVVESLQLATASAREKMAATLDDTPGRRGVNAAIDNYLSDTHLHEPCDNCALVSLSSELARGSDEVREATSAGVVAMIDMFAEHLAGEMTPAAARKQASVIVSTMIGALTVARLVQDEALAASVLREARKALHL